MIWFVFWIFGQSWIRKVMVCKSRHMLHTSYNSGLHFEANPCYTVWGNNHTNTLKRNAQAHINLNRNVIQFLFIMHTYPAKQQINASTWAIGDVSETVRVCILVWHVEQVVSDEVGPSTGPTAIGTYPTHCTGAEFIEDLNSLLFRLIIMKNLWNILFYQTIDSALAENGTVLDMVVDLEVDGLVSFEGRHLHCSYWFLYEKKNFLNKEKSQFSHLRSV